MRHLLECFNVHRVPFRLRRILILARSSDEAYYLSYDFLRKICWNCLSFDMWHKHRVGSIEKFNGEMVERTRFMEYIDVESEAWIREKMSWKKRGVIERECISCNKKCLLFGMSKKIKKVKNCKKSVRVSVVADTENMGMLDFLEPT